MAETKKKKTKVPKKRGRPKKPAPPKRNPETFTGKAFTPEQYFVAVLPVVRGERSIREACNMLGISYPTYHAYIDMFNSGDYRFLVDDKGKRLPNNSKKEEPEVKKKRGVRKEFIDEEAQYDPK